MKSPFKFLDAYTPEDRDVFFGRDQEVETLYNLVFKSKLLLVYGQSGTGKTSLVQCGLGGKFDLTDWFPFQVRRNDNINHALSEALSGPIGGNLRNDSLTETIAYLYKNFLRPVYLIFDQFEELFILGNEEEQQRFISSIKEILEAELPCKIVLVMREEYIAQLYAFEQIIPSLFDRRLRVEPMNYANVSKVITGSCQQFNIKMEEEATNVTQIIDNISGGKSGIQLPYLQVYLDRLWQEDFKRTYPGGVSDDSGFPPLEFTAEEITELGDIEGVLETFLQQQRNEIQQQISTDFENVPAEATQMVLDLFVTEEGTKRPVLYERVEGSIRLETALHKQLEDIPEPALQEILKSLEQVRILRFTEAQVELAHDSLAELIDKERSTEQRQLNQVKRRIAAAYVEQRETGVFLSTRQLASIEDFLPPLKLEPHLAQFIKDSYTDAKRKEEAEKDRVRVEIQLFQDKLDVEQRARKRQRIFSFIIGIALIGALITGSWAWNQTQELEKNQVILESQKQKIQLESEKTEKALKDFRTVEADKISSEVDDILRRANILKEKGYQEPYTSLLLDAQKLLEAYQENPLLANKKREIETLLAE